MLFTYVPAPEDLVRLLDSLLNLYKQHVVIQGDGTRVEIIHQVSFVKCVEVIARALVLSRIAHEVFTKLGLLRKPSENVELELEDVKRLALKLFRHLEKYENFVLRDYIKLKSRTEKLCTEISEFTCLKRLWGDCRVCEEFTKNVENKSFWQKFVRDFLAHSGLEGCVTEIKCEISDSTKRVKLRYKDSLREYILRASSEGLNRV